MNLIQEVETAMKTFMKMKALMCKNNNGPYDLAPMLHIKYSHINSYCGVLMSGPGSPIDQIPSVWGKIIESGTPEFVMIMTEAYASQCSRENYRRGEMEKDFKNNPFSEVIETLNIHAIDIKNGNQFSGLVSFKYNDVGQPEFDEPSYYPCEGDSLNARTPMLFAACRDATLALNRKAI